MYQRGRFDIESDGLLETVSKVHCLGLQLDDQPARLFIGHDQIMEGLALLDECSVITAHNAIGYDLIVLWRILRWKPKAVVEDTLTLSCLITPDILGGHSLEEWGVRLKQPKLDYTTDYITWAKGQWSQTSPYHYMEGDEWLSYNPVMGNYCLGDVAVLVKLDEYFLQARKAWDWQPSINMEHQFAKDFAVQGLRGVAIDREHCSQLLGTITKEMDAIAAYVEPMLPAKLGTLAQQRECIPPKLAFKKDGTPSAVNLKWFDKVWQDAELNGGKWWCEWQGQTFEFPTSMEDDGESRKPLRTMFPMTLANQQDVKAWLMDQGWKPTMWSFKKEKDKNGKMRLVRGDDGNLIPTHPKLHDKGVLCINLEKMISEGDIPDVAKKLVRWVIIRHRRGLVQSIIDHCRPDGTVSATGFALGTPTSRVTHSVIANIPKCDPSVVLGRECRAMFISRPGRVLVGVDASGLELRCLAHYVGSQELTDVVVKGCKPKLDDGSPNPEYIGVDEIHLMLWKLCQQWVPSRNAQKNVTYGWLYGASDKKLGQTAGHPDHVAEKVGKSIRSALIKGVPGLEALMKDVESASRVGFIKAIDGRKIEIRSKHATLNTLLQSCGSILVKAATCYMNKRIRKLKLDAFMVVHYHDEVVIDSHPSCAREAGQLFIDGLEWAERHYGIKVPLTGAMAVGNSWADIH